MSAIEHLCCQNSHCPDAGRRGQGNLTFRGGSGRGKRIRMVSCRTCKARVSERTGTVLEQARLPDATVLDVLNPIREGGGTRATSRRVGGDKNTVTRSRAQAGAHAEALHEELVALSPRTREVPVDEKWALVGPKEASCDRLDPRDRRRGDDWDHTAVDPESRLLLAVVPGKRDGDTGERLIPPVHDRTAGRTDGLLTSDEPAPQETAIREVDGIEQPRPKRPGPGRPPTPVKVRPADLCDATGRKRREKGRVVEMVRPLVFGTRALLQALLDRSTVRTTVNTSFGARHKGTDRHQNSRKRRQTYAFSTELGMHRAASDFVGSSSNFCWVVRTLRVRAGDGCGIPRTPAMAVGLAERIWSLAEWVTYPARPG